MQRKCTFCNIATNKQLLREYEHWIVLLHENQVYLGRTMVVLKTHKEDLTELGQAEKTELFRILEQLKEALKSSFNPTMMNYASLGNVINHVHMHVIPRYDHSERFEGIEFTDKRWGQNYAPYDKNSTIPESVRNKIKEKILENL